MPNLYNSSCRGIVSSLAIGIGDVDMEVDDVTEDSASDGEEDVEVEVDVDAVVDVDGLGALGAFLLTNLNT